VIFPTLTEDEIRTASVTSVAEWDSLAALNLALVVEQEFGLRVSPDDMDEMVSFELIAELLRRKQSAC
jgi:acyl carrier protein